MVPSHLLRNYNHGLPDDCSKLLRFWNISDGSSHLWASCNVHCLGRSLCSVPNLIALADAGD
jgi:hypothetical protein